VVKEILAAELLEVRESFIAEDVGCRDAFQLAAVAAGPTSTIRLTIGVTNPYTRTPSALALSYLTLSELASGRARLGLGSSSREIIEGQLGITYGRPIEVLAQAIERIRAELLEAAAERTMPLLLAAMGPRMLRLAGAVADSVLLNTGVGPKYLRWAVSEVRSAALEVRRNPADVGVAVWIPVYLGEDRVAALGRARRWAAGMLSIPDQGELLLEKAGLNASIAADVRRHYRAYPHAGDIDRAALEVPHDVVTTLAVVGDVDSAIQRLEDYVKAGADTLIVAPESLRQIVRAISDAKGRGSSLPLPA
jgi:5,10-methylenetetrahydromethanopterin reductase